MSLYIYDPDGLQGLHWSINGLLASYAEFPDTFVDGFREVNAATAFNQLILSQREDGSVGATAVYLYQVDVAGVEALVATVGMAAGGGQNARELQLVNFTIAANVRLGIKVTAAQTLGVDASITLRAA